MGLPAQGAVIFGQYELVRRIARGGMAEIFLAIQRGIEGIEREVVVKRILPHMGESDDFVTMFMDEARVAARLAHPNVAHIYDFGQIDGVYYLAMEYVEGLTSSRLARVSRPEPLPVDIAIRIVSDACAGLHYAHEAKDPEGLPLGLVHRDVSPQNVMVSKTGVAKILDFGVARASTQVHATQVGQVKGKFGYIAPEQYMNAPIDRRADVFGLGVVLYELVAGARLFARGSEGATVQAVLNENPPRILRAGVPDEVNEIVARAVAKRAEHRFASALELQEAIEDLTTRHRLVVSPMALGRFVAAQMDRAAQQSQAAAARGAAERDLPEATPSGSGPVVVTPSQPLVPPAVYIPLGDHEGQAIDVPITHDGGEDVEATPFTPAPVSASGVHSGMTPGPASDLTEGSGLRRSRVVVTIAVAATLGAVAAVALMLALGPTGGEEDGSPTSSVVAARAVPAEGTGPGPSADAGRLEAPVVIGFPVPGDAGSAEGAPTSGDDAAAAPPPARRDLPHETKRPPREPTPARQAPVKTEPRQTGTLFVHTTPWSRVTVDGRPLGNTPLANASLPVGSHTLVLTDAEGNRHRKRIRIRPNEATKIFVDLRSP